MKWGVTMRDIHELAVIDPAAEIADDVQIGPFCVIGAGVKLGSGIRLHSHVCLHGETEIGEGTEIFPFASIGARPQVLSQAQPVGILQIGKHNVIREYVTIQPGQIDNPAVTRVGDHNLIMANAHIAHDCSVGDRNVLANSVALAGHVRVGNYVTIGGLTGVHQFCELGDHSFVGANGFVTGNIIPFGMVNGPLATLRGLNIIGMKRRGFSRDDIQTVRQLYADVFGRKAQGASTGSFDERVAAAQKSYGLQSSAQKVIDFILNANDRGFCQNE